MSSFGSLSITSLDQDSRNRVLAHVATSKLLAVAGLTIYVVSFFLWATGDRIPTASPLRGYFCAYFALLFPWGRDGWGFLHDRPFEYFSLLISGWINPLFLGAVVVGFWIPRSSAAFVLRVLTSLSIPFCWVVFAYEGFYPREGHILWIAGMVLTLVAAWLAKPAGE